MAVASKKAVKTTVASKTTVKNFGHDGYGDEGMLFTKAKAIEAAQAAANNDGEPVVVWQAIGIVVPNYRKNYRELDHLPVLTKE